MRESGGGDGGGSAGALCVYVVSAHAAEWGGCALLHAALLRRAQRLERTTARGWGALWARSRAETESSRRRAQRTQLRRLALAARALRRREARRAPARALRAALSGDDATAAAAVGDDAGRGAAPQLAEESAVESEQEQVREPGTEHVWA